ncbi:hypothetical protein [Corynebacterium macclintockiae]|uniref:hypothetical protein n=1 Tax=Corynebacterium macclintockiae TaxID=2913501 RepID=UPI003EC05492
MKRFSQSLTAVAMAGALALGGATVAQAQIPAPAEITVDGVVYQKQADGNYKSKVNEDGMPGSTLTAEQAQAEWEKQQGNADEDTPGDQNEGIPAPATKKDKFGNTCYQHLQDPNVYVKDPNKVNEPITDEMRAECQEFDKKQLAWLALPAALIIGGIVWHLANDGKTYVKDENSKEAPSAEEKAASDKMLQENKDEVIAQGGKLAGQDAGAANTDRGMLAQTGSNTAARGLAALAVLAMVAAGAFAVRRKIFA